MVLSTKPFKKLIIPLVPTMVMACSGGSRVETSVVAVENTDDSNATIAVSVTRTNSNCDTRDEKRCAEVDAVRQLLFSGVPGTVIPRPMIPNETSSVAGHRRFFEELLEDGGHRRFIVRSDAGSGSAWTVVVNHQLLRTSLEREGVIRRFGF